LNASCQKDLFPINQSMSFFKTPFYSLILICLLAGCAPRQPSPLAQSLFIKLQQQLQVVKGIYFSGRLKVKRAGYGFAGRIEAIWTPKRVRLDIYTALGWPLFTAVKKNNTLTLFVYGSGRVYKQGQALKILKSCLPVRLQLEDWVRLFGCQMWYLEKERGIKQKEQFFVLSFTDKNGVLREKIWLKRQTLKVTRIILQNAEGDWFWEVKFTYKDNKPVLALFRDILGTSIQIDYDQVKLNPQIKDTWFVLPFPSPPRTE